MSKLIFNINKIKFRSDLINENCIGPNHLSNHNSKKFVSQSSCNYIKNKFKRLSLSELPISIVNNNSLGTQKLSIAKAPTTFTNLGHNLVIFFKKFCK